MQVQRHAQSWTRKIKYKDIYNMRQWKVKNIAIAASNDDGLANFINGIESEPDCKVKEVIFLGNDSIGVRLYQILYVEG